MDAPLTMNSLDRIENCKERHVERAMSTKAQTVSNFVRERYVHVHWRVGFLGAVARNRMPQPNQSEYQEIAYSLDSVLVR